MGANAAPGFEDEAVNNILPIVGAEVSCCFCLVCAKLPNSQLQHQSLQHGQSGQLIPLTQDVWH